MRVVLQSIRAARMTPKKADYSVKRSRFGIEIPSES